MYTTVFILLCILSGIFYLFLVLSDSFCSQSALVGLTNDHRSCAGLLISNTPSQSCTTLVLQYHLDIQFQSRDPSKSSRTFKLSIFLLRQIRLQPSAIRSEFDRTSVRNVRCLRCLLGFWAIPCDVALLMAFEAFPLPLLSTSF
jgi:hypothetical protein